MTTPESSHPRPNPADATLRPHTFDGIQEYDQRLPRWWLLTLYGAIVFSIGYWGYYHTYQIGAKPEVALEKEMAENVARATQKSGVIDDEVLWKMSRDAQIVAAGKTTFDTTCAACHKPDLTGLIGPNLVDNQWIHGGTPLNSAQVILDGVAAKGMPAWAPMLGKQKTNEVVAYIFSHHQPGETVVLVPGWTPPGASAPTP
jgi:cytochrome c oxidase cbb3-type subunit III